MYCKKCGKELKDEAKFCPQCGERTAAGNQIKNTNSSEVSNAQIEEQHKSKRSFKPLIITLTVLFLIMAAVAAGILLSGKKKDNDNSPEKVRTGQSKEHRKAKETTASETEESPVEITPENISETVVWQQETQQQVIPNQNPAAYLVDASQVNGSGGIKLSYLTCGESSHIVQENHDNTAKAAMDNNEVTSWQEYVAGAGINESLWYSFDSTYEISYLSFKLGNWRNDRLFYANNRPKRLRIDIDGYTTEIEFPAEKQEYWVELPYCAGQQIIITVLDTYEGTGEYDDTCIAEIGVYAR